MSKRKERVSYERLLRFITSESKWSAHDAAKINDVIDYAYKHRRLSGKERMLLSAALDARR